MVLLVVADQRPEPCLVNEWVKPPLVAGRTGPGTQALGRPSSALLTRPDVPKETQVGSEPPDPSLSQLGKNKELSSGWLALLPKCFHLFTS